MDAFALSPLQPLNLTENVSHNFKLWLQRFQIYLKAHNLDKETEERQVNILLNYTGDKCITVFNSFNLTNAESKSIKTVIDKFTDHFAPKKHLTLLRHNFFAREQKSDEPFEDYFTAIINLGLQCDLEALREELTKAKIISGLDSKYDDLRTRLMAEEDKTLSLSYVTKYLKTAESSRQAVTQMQKDNRVDVFPMSEDELLAKSKVIKLVNLESQTSINACKSIFVHGIPVVVVTDAGTQFSSQKFKDFASNYGFTHITASAKWSQSNGQSESAVKIVKNIFKKCQLARDDPWLGLMEYRNTPKEHMPSPAQLLYSRNLRARIPVRSEDLKPKVYRLPEKFVRHEDTVKKYCDKRTTSLQPLREGQDIRFQKHQSGHWYAGKVKGKGPQPRSYQVRDHSGNLFTRNRVMINPSPRQSSPTPATPTTSSDSSANRRFHLTGDCRRKSCEEFGQ
ncbi:hypothetical protein ILUMI_18687 [Ignelater luminosus]|uniref:Integrase catalytic domain-containing protein n=1 Tax=Ignelater luminosus TaxID=2038154 RepID=A0A8K0CM17_IGNLU|nr:hypothetical protein ILUMI_18687 [Ignelater luminosus]